MVHEQAHGVEKETEQRDTKVGCPSCGKLNELDRSATIALPKANAFPAECLVLEAVECTQCGCVSFFKPSAVRQSSKRQTRVLDGNDSPRN
jgi:hypothetical protein